MYLSIRTNGKLPVCIPRSLTRNVRYNLKSKYCQAQQTKLFQLALAIENPLVL